jgi:hypothetical protein
VLGANEEAAGWSTATGSPDLHANVSNRQLVRNFATGYLSVIVSLVSGLIVVPVILRALGESHYGLVVVMTSVGVLMSVFDAGVWTATVQAGGALRRLKAIMSDGRRSLPPAGGSTA